MWISAVFILLSLLFVYKNNKLLSRIFIVTSLVVYLLTSWNDIGNVFMLIKSGLLSFQSLLWYAINLLLFIVLLISVFKGIKKASLWLLWIILIVIILSNWNWLFTYLYSLRAGI